MGVSYCTITFKIFQSTSPVRGTTEYGYSMDAGKYNFNPHPPCGGRHILRKMSSTIRKFQSTSPVRGTTADRTGTIAVMLISIHVPRAGDDLRHTGNDEVHKVFQSTSPVRGTTLLWHLLVQPISYFNPRPPHGGRLLMVQMPLQPLIFQSTSPARGTTSVNFVSMCVCFQ